ncbi:organomercurial lyase [Streptomyces sp. NPDC050738]|uniref:organomercurial lyase n=1 Tax=Streptomyces sp. NPDC050738 TaxID=3154744 RepID=UPI003439797C
MDVRAQELADLLVAKWASPRGVHLMEAGATVVGGLLAEGPLTPARAGELLGWPGEQVLDRFREMDFDLETDRLRRIVGAGVSLDMDRPYAMELQGRRVTGWCAMDVLMFPVVLKETRSAVTGRCAATGVPVSLTVTPEGVRDLTPASAAVTLAPATGADIRPVFCDRVNFYADSELAAGAVAADPDLAVCTVADAWAVGRRLAGLFG